MYAIIYVLISMFLNLTPLSLSLSLRHSSWHQMVIKTKSVKFMPFNLSLANFLNGLVWLIYALLEFDVYLVVRQDPGFFCRSSLQSMIQISKRLLFKNTFEWSNITWTALWSLTLDYREARFILIFHFAGASNINLSPPFCFPVFFGWQIPNGLGALSGAVQLILYATYYKSTKWDDQPNPPPSDFNSPPRTLPPTLILEKRERERGEIRSTL